MKPRIIIAACALMSVAVAAAAADLSLPAPATMTGERNVADTDYPLAIGPWADGQVPRLDVAGALTQQAWRIGTAAQDAFQIMTQLEGQLAQAGYDVIFRCGQDDCGGFDFRFATIGLPEPAMHVDLGDYRYLAARKPGEGGMSYISLMVSHSPGAGYVEITRIVPADAAAVPAASATVATMTETGAAASGSLADRLEAMGHAVLDDLEFQTGSADLGQGPFTTLADLAAYLDAHAGATVALVGHTDAEGSLDANIALSRRRADSVRDRLISDYGTDPNRVEARGVGYLSPLASNLTEAGRTRNRRVEAVLTSTE